MPPHNLINKLQRLKNSALRFIFNIAKLSRQHISPLRTKLHWLPIKSSIIYNISLTIHLSTHLNTPTLNTPDYLANLLTPNITIYEQQNKQIQIKYSSSTIFNIYPT